MRSVEAAGAAGAAASEPAEPAEPVDHRDIGRRLDLFHFQEEAPGMVFWHPAGMTLYRVLEDAARRQVLAQGYQEVRTPQLCDQRLWEKSGHWQHFREDMFVLAAEEPGGRAQALKPVSCPGHIGIAAHAALSYRDLPLRLAEMGLVHRNEASGALAGLFRLRQFTQDDGHVFCAEDQLVDEVARFCAGLRRFYPAFGFAEARVYLATRPPARAGDDAIWDRAEAALADAVRAAGVGFEPNPGGGAFYGPKLEFVLEDRSGRSWQCGTIQADLILPERFDLAYVAAGGHKQRPVLLHRAMYGSIERFLAVLLEHHGAALPAWLAPEQVCLATVGDGEAVLRSAQAIAARLGAAGVRARLDAASATLSRRVRDAHERGIPYLLVVGAREAARGTVSLRPVRGNVPARELAVDAAVAQLAGACAPPC
jgi:threonyl-tRNA synthetase